MHYLKLSLLSCVLLGSPILRSMDFHQKVVDRYQHGIDLIAVIALENQQALLPCAGQNKSIHGLLNDGACDAHNPLNEAILYVLEHNKVVDKGFVADYYCADIQQLLESHGKGLYAVYTKGGRALSALLLGTSNENNVGLLTDYLISQYLQPKENRGMGHDTLSLQRRLAPYTLREKLPLQERAI
jgi:hypothetical protein